MRFKAYIEQLGYEGNPSKEGGAIIPSFIFSRKRIWFTEKHNDKYYTNPFFTQMIQHESEYTFDKVYNKMDKKVWKIIYVSGDSSVIRLNLWNRIKCNIIHKRYFIQGEADWFWKTIIAAAFGALFGLIGTGVGYRSGVRDGIEAYKNRIQDTSQKLQSRTNPQNRQTVDSVAYNGNNP